MKWNLKLKAGALQFVLFIGVVIAILLLTFVTLSYTHSFFGKKTGLLIQTIRNADLGLAYAMNSDMVLKDTVTLPLDIADPITLKAYKTYWGIFEKYTLVASFQKNKFTKNILVGGGLDDNAPALFLKDMDRPMVIAGNAKITGAAFLPKQGIRRGNISGNSYVLKELVYGEQKISKSELPPLERNLIEQLNNLEQFPSEGNGATTSLANKTTIKVSFNEPTQLVYGSTITISDLQLTGNIIIQASQKIIIEQSATLKDIVLIAPEIRIEDKVKGTFQAIASRFITVGKGCQLEYPSALVVHDKSRSAINTTQQTKPNIFIRENTVITGVVVYVGGTKEQFFYPQLKIESGVKITGEVYCEEGLELKGEVIGSVTTARFMALENGNMYQNHLYNGQINSTLLSKEYVGLLYRNATHKKKVSKWLY